MLIEQLMEMKMIKESTAVSHQQNMAKLDQQMGKLESDRQDARQVAKQHPDMAQLHREYLELQARNASVGDACESLASPSCDCPLAHL